MSSKDKRIVQMQFDNVQFEREASRTMSTLDKLKESLKLDRSAAAFNKDLSSAVALSNTQLRSLVQSLDNSFHDIGTIFKSSLITKGIEAAFFSVKKAYDATIGQIVTGGKSRAQNIAQAKFQLEGLKVAWKDIEPDISYAVNATAYGLDSAAKVASQLVASGVQIGDDMKTALRGISGVAAMTNSSYDEIGHIFTTVAGNGRVMGDQLTQLASRGLNVAATLAEAYHVTEGELREMVSKGKVDFAAFAKAMDDAYGEHAKEANNTFTGALSNMKSALSRVGELFATPAYENLKTVINATTPVINDFKAALVPVSEQMTKLMETAANLAKTILENFDTDIFKKITTPISFLIDTANESLEALSKAYVDKSNIEEATKAVEEYTEAEKKAAETIWLGEKGRGNIYGDGEKRRRLLEAEGLSYERVQKYLQEYVMTGKEVEEQEKAVASAQDTLSKKLKWKSTLRSIGFSDEAIKTINNIAASMMNLGHALKNTVASAFNIAKAALKGFFGGIEYEEGSDSFLTFSKRLADLSDELYISKDKTQWLTGACAKLAKIVSNAAIKIFKFGDSLYTFFSEFQTFYSLGVDTTDAKTYAAEADMSSFATTLAKVVKWIKDAGTAVKNFFKEIPQLSNFGRLENALSGIGDAFQNIFGSKTDSPTDQIEAATDGFDNTATSMGNVQVAMDGALPVINDCVGGIADILEKVPDALDSVSKLINKFTEPVSMDESPFAVVSNLLDKLFTTSDNEGGKKSIETTSHDVAQNATKGFFEGFLDGFKSIDWDRVERLGMFAGIIGTLLTLAIAIGKVNQTIQTFSKAPVTILGTIKSFKVLLDTVTTGLKSFTNSASISMLALSIAALVMALTMLADVPVNDLARVTVYTVLIIEALKSLANATTGTLSYSKQIDKSVHKIGGTLIDPVTGLGIMLFGLAAAMGSIIAAVVIFSKIDEKALTKGFTTAAAIMGIIAAFAVVMAIVSKKIGPVMVAGTFAMFLGIGMAIDMIVLAIGWLSLVPNDTGQVSKAMGTVISVMVAFAALLAGAGAFLAFSKAGPVTLITLGVFLMMASGAMITVVTSIAYIAALFGSLGVNAGVIIATFAGIALVIGITLALMTKMIDVAAGWETKGSLLISLGSMFLIASVSLIAIAGALAIVMKTMPNGGTLAAAAISLGILMAVIMGILAGLSMIVKEKLASTSDLLIVAASMVIATTALMVIAGALMTLSKVHLGDSEGLGALVTYVALALGSMLGLALIGTRFSRGIVTIAAAFLMFGAAAVLFGVGTVTIAIGCKKLATALPQAARGIVEFVDILSANELAVGMFIGTLVVLTIGLVAIIAALIKFGPAITAACEAFAIVVTGFVNSIETMNPKIRKAIGTFLVSAIAGLTIATPEVMAEISNLLDTLFANLATLAEPISQGIIIVLVSIINALAATIRENAGPIWAAVINLLGALLELILLGIQYLIAPLLYGIGSLLYSAFRWLSNWLWTNIFQPLEQTVLSAIDWMFESYIEAVTRGWKRLIGGLVKTGSALLMKGSELLDALGFDTSAINESIANLNDGALNSIDSFFDSVEKGAKRGYREVSDVVGPIVAGIPETFGGMGVLMSKYGAWLSDDEWASATSDLLVALDDGMVVTRAGLRQLVDDSALALNAQQQLADTVTTTNRSIAVSNQHAIDEAARLGITIEETNKKAESSGNNLMDSLISNLTSNLSSNITADQIKDAVSKNLVTGTTGAVNDFNVDAVLSDLNVNPNSSDYSNLTKGFNALGTSNMADWSQGLLDNDWMLVDASNTAGNTMATDGFNFSKSGKQSGVDFSQGMVQGVDSWLGQINFAGARAGNALSNGARSTLDEHSPSKIAMQIGEFFSLGMAIGVENKTSAVVDAASTMASDTVDIFSESLQTISDAISSDVEANPTIRPVMDLTNVQSSVGSINSMFAHESGRLAGINSRLARESEAYRFELDQNSRYDNSNVVASILGLQSEMTDLKEAMMNTQIVMDTGVMVGQLTPGMDKSLGRLSSRKARKN